MEEELYKRIIASFPDSECLGIKREYKTGQSGALVFAVQYRSESDYGMNGAFIVKIGSEKWAKEEKALYKSLSSSALDPLLTRRHMTSNTVEGQAAVAYDIAFDSPRIIQPLIDILHDKEGQSEEETQRQIESLSHALVQWYLDGKLADNSVVEDPYKLLRRMLTDRRADDLLERLQSALPFWRSDTPQIAVQGLKSLLPNPLAYMQKELWQRIKAGFGLHCPLGRIHGDLHTGNIICLPVSQSIPKVIDFDQSSEKGVPFFDLAYLEYDIIRQLLPIEQEENRRYWLSLLDFSMTEEESDPQKLPWSVARTWQFVKPIRQRMQQLQEFGGEEYGIVRWLATVAVGLNFARKEKQGRSSFERMAGLLYAAYGLACTLKMLHVKEAMTEQPFFVPWLRGEGSSLSPSDFHISYTSQENLPDTFSEEVKQTVPIETSQDTQPALSQFTSLNLPLDQGSSIASESIREFFEEAAIPSDEATSDVTEVPHHVAEHMPKTAEKSAPRSDMENPSIEAAEKIRSLLQISLDCFNAGGLIFRDECDAANSALQQLEAYLQEVNKGIPQTSYEIIFSLNDALKLEKNARADLHDFRKICPPLNMGRLDSHYNEGRDTIAHMLNETLAKFLELLKNLLQEFK